ncbi:hypothetical protein SEA_PINKIEPIE_179 [Streptomyces phage PinkiePie]|nr:hypothetical protein SEA_SQUILLIUM_182 [Streptomyces phage Squillium]WNM74808.1 hypothetical protein SEA_PINKIEPIE_179 [Streptomyces phage PinkiePie]
MNTLMSTPIGDSSPGDALVSTGVDDISLQPDIEEMSLKSLKPINANSKFAFALAA